jgi:hypothetical protein
MHENKQMDMASPFRSSLGSNDTIIFFFAIKYVALSTTE